VGCARQDKVKMKRKKNEPTSDIHPILGQKLSNHMISTFVHWHEFNNVAHKQEDTQVEYVYIQMQYEIN